MKPYIRSGSGHVCTTDPSIVAAAVPGSMRLANLLARGAKFRPEGCKIDFCETHGDSLYGHVQEEITHWLTLLMEKYGMPRCHFSKFESAFYQKVQEWEGVIEAEKDKADSIDPSAPFDPLPYEALERLHNKFDATIIASIPRARYQVTGLINFW